MQINTNTSSAYFYNNSLSDTNKTTPKKEEAQKQEEETLNSTYKRSAHEIFMEETLKQLEKEGKSDAEVAAVWTYLTASFLAANGRENGKNLLANGKSLWDASARVEQFENATKAQRDAMFLEQIEVLRDTKAIGANIAPSKPLTNKQEAKLKEDTIALLLKEISGK